MLAFFHWFRVKGNDQILTLYFLTVRSILKHLSSHGKKSRTWYSILVDTRENVLIKGDWRADLTCKYI
jgi:hypothetical protein